MVRPKFILSAPRVAVKPAMKRVVVRFGPSSFRISRNLFIFIQDRGGKHPVHVFALLIA